MSYCIEFQTFVRNGKIKPKQFSTIRLTIPKTSLIVYKQAEREIPEKIRKQIKFRHKNMFFVNP